MSRTSLIVTLAGLALAGCAPGGGRSGFEEQACTDAGECFDARVVDQGPDVASPDMTSRDMSSDMASPDMSSDMSSPDMSSPDMSSGMASPDMSSDMVSPDMATPDMSSDMASPDMASPDMASPDAGPQGPVDSCDQIGSTECFGHPDCADDRRCEDVGPEGIPVPCCVPGRRGEIPPGGSCAGVDGQIECRSGVCIEGAGDDVCSGPCARAADCPANLPRCVAFPFGGTDFQWCFPE